VLDYKTTPQKCQWSDENESASANSETPSWYGRWIAQMERFLQQSKEGQVDDTAPEQNVHFESH
jgi:hypothetical protein